MNYLIRYIGIFYYNKEWAKQLFDDILHETPPETIYKYFPNLFQIRFKDGSCLDIVNANIQAKARRFSEIYIQDGLDVKIYQQIICPCLNLSSHRKRTSVQVIRNAEDILMGYICAQEYYSDLKND